MKKLVVLIVFISLIFVSCNPHDIVTDAPDLPDFEVLSLNYPKFIDSAQIDTNYKFVSDYSNFLYARKVLILWRKRIVDESSLVFKMLDSLDSLEFSYWGNKTWHSQKIFSIDSNRYKVDVYGTVNSEENVFWELFVTVNQNKQFKFLEGYVYSNSQEWTIYKHNIVNYKSIKLDISRNGQNNYTKNYYIIDENNDFLGSNVELEKTDSLTKVKILDTSLQITYKIYFGNIVHFGGICIKDCDCWDENFNNSDSCYSCPFN